jgi:hypothetical protein
VAAPTGLWLDSRGRVELDLLILAENADDFLVLHQKANADPALQDDHDQFFDLADQAMAEAQRFLVNWLAAATALADHTMRHVKKFAPTVLVEYQRKVQALMLSTPAFHLMRVLRTEAQHRALPLVGARARWSRIRSTDEPNRVRFAWYLSKDWLLGLEANWPDIVLEFLDRETWKEDERGAVNLLADEMGENDVDLDWLVETYTAHARELTSWLLNAELELHEADLAEMSAELERLDARAKAASSWQPTDDLDKEGQS